MELNHNNGHNTKLPVPIQPNIGLDSDAPIRLWKPSTINLFTTKARKEFLR
jgi:hypothetical protein